MKQILIVGGANGIGLAMSQILANKPETEKVYIIDKAKLNEDYGIVRVDKFKNARMAQNYIESVIVAGEVFDGVISDSYKQYIISKSKSLLNII